MENPQNVVCHDMFLRTHLLAIFTDVFFYCCLFIHCMITMINKAMFTVIDAVNPKMRNIKKSIINITSNLTTSCCGIKEANHICLSPFPSFDSISWN